MVAHNIEIYDSSNCDFGVWTKSDVCMKNCHNNNIKTYSARQEDMEKLTPTFNCRIRKAFIIRRRYDPRPRLIWDVIQCHRNHYGKMVHYIINCLLRRARNSIRGKVTGVWGSPQSIRNSKPPTPSSDSILCAWYRVLHATPYRSWISTHHQCPAPTPAPMYRTINVSAA